jgi:hypothetical protein
MPMLALQNTSVPSTAKGGHQVLLDALGHPGGVGGGAQVLEEDGEVVAAQAGQGVPGAQRALEAAGDLDQEVVAGVVAEAVVDALEAIDVEVQHRERQGVAGLALGPPEQVLDPVHEQGPVGQVGERVVQAMALELLGDALVLGDVAGDPEGADDVPVRIAQRHLGGRHPAHAAVGEGLLLVHVHERHARAQDVLLVAIGLLGVLGGEEVEVGLAQRLDRVGQPQPARHVTADAGEAAAGVLEVDVVGDGVEQDGQEEGLVVEGLRADRHGQRAVQLLERQILDGRLQAPAGPAHRGQRGSCVRTDHALGRHLFG